MACFEEALVDMRPSSAAVPSRPVILFVDDDELIRELWTEMLSARIPELRAAYAENGADAVRIARELQPDLILMDVNMPAVTGFDATRSIKKSRSTANIPVIAVTGLDYPSEEAKAAGCDGYIQKPISPDQLFAEVSRFLKPVAA
jgi:two-component system, cell cycle response regulator DivK